MATSSILRYFLLNLALVGVLALGVNSCAAPEETATSADAEAASETTSDDDAATDGGDILSNSLYVVVGQSGTVLTSPHGNSWSLRNSETSNDLHEVTFGKGTFVAVGDNGTILTSTNGIWWFPKTSETSNNLNHVIFENSTFMVVGDNGTILTSIDGNNWTSIGPKWDAGGGYYGSEPPNLYGITYGNNTFVAVGRVGLNRGSYILTSSDGTTWSIKGSVIGDTPRAVAYGNNTFVVVCGGGKVLVKSDVTNLTDNDAYYIGKGIQQDAVVYGNNTFVSVAGLIYTSSDGKSWTLAKQSYNGFTEGYGLGSAIGAIYINDSFMAVGWYGQILTSADGKSWTTKHNGNDSTAVTKNSLYGVAFGE